MNHLLDTLGFQWKSEPKYEQPSEDLETVLQQYEDDIIDLVSAVTAFQGKKVSNFIIQFLQKYPDKINGDDQYTNRILLAHEYLPIILRRNDFGLNDKTIIELIHRDDAIGYDPENESDFDKNMKILEVANVSIFEKAAAAFFYLWSDESSKSHDESTYWLILNGFLLRNGQRRILLPSQSMQAFRQLLNIAAETKITSDVFDFLHSFRPIGLL
jgi:hypothetical protein